jgi:uncharacterized protein (DUF697 family)
MSLPVSAGAIRKLLREVESSGGGEHVLAVGGARELAPLLRQQLLRGGADPEAVRLGDPAGARVYVHVLAGRPADEDFDSLRRAAWERVPAVAVAFGLAADAPAIPYVLATDVVRATAGGELPLEAIVRTIAARLGERGAPLAGRVPILREAVCEQLVASFARRNGIVAAAAWLPGADFPLLTLNQLRLVLRVAQAHGADGPRVRLPELAATLGAGFGLRALARELLDRAPGAAWLLHGAIAYGGTRLLGEAARLRFELVPGARPRRAATWHAAP